MARTGYQSVYVNPEESYCEDWLAVTGYNDGFVGPTCARDNVTLRYDLMANTVRSPQHPAYPVHLPNSHRNDATVLLSPLLGDRCFAR